VKSTPPKERRRKKESASTRNRHLILENAEFSRVEGENGIEKGTGPK